MTITAEVHPDPYRDVIYIGIQKGNRDGWAWRLVLRCGHAVWRPFPTMRVFTARLRFAPRRVRCVFCGAGCALVELDAAIDLGKRLDERGTIE